MPDLDLLWLSASSQPARLAAAEQFDAVEERRLRAPEQRLRLAHPDLKALLGRASTENVLEVHEVRWVAVWKRFEERRVRDAEDERRGPDADCQSRRSECRGAASPPEKSDRLPQIVAHRTSPAQQGTSDHGGGRCSPITFTGRRGGRGGGRGGGGEVLMVFVAG